MTLFVSILDRYLVKKFLAVLTFALIAMVSIFVAVNYVENADKFIDRKVPTDIIISYYLNFIPNIITLTLPVDILLASLFSIGGLARFNELTAIKASGVSLYRLIFPVWICAAGVSLLNFWISENIVPAANQKKTDLWQTHVERVNINRRAMGRDIAMYDPSGVKVFIDKFDKNRLVASNISIQKFFGTQLIERMDALEASWDSAKSSWTLKNVSVRIFDQGHEKVERLTALVKDDLFFDPEDILRRESSPEEMNFQEMSAFITKLRRSGARTERWEVDYYLKFSYPLTCFIMVLFGAPLAASRRKSGAGMNIFLTLVICFSYWILIQMGRWMGYSQSLTPIQAAWLGNAVFGFLSILILSRMKS